MAELNNNHQIQGKKGRIHKAAPKVDLTAMVDLAFLLITFFMLTTSLNKPNALDVAVPDKNMDTPEDMDERRIVNLIIYEKKFDIVHGDMMSPITTVKNISNKESSLKNQLIIIEKSIDKLTGGKKSIVLIKPTIEANTKAIIECFDEIKTAGIKHYMLSKLNQNEQNLISAR